MRRDRGGFSERERLVVLGLDAVAYVILGVIVGWAWAVVICFGVYCLWFWLANRSAP